MSNDKKQQPYGTWHNLTKKELKQIEEKKMANAEKPIKINMDFKSALKKVAITKVKS